MKKKTFVVSYSYSTTYDTPIFLAKTKKEAVRKVQEVIGADIKIEQVWEVNPASVGLRQ